MKQRMTLLLCLALMATGKAMAQSPIPMDITPEGHLLVKATVNGVEGNFIFDTGGGLNAITRKFANRLQNLVKQDGGYTGFRATGERIDAELYTARDLAVGAYSNKAPVLAVIDADFGPIDGLISLINFRDQPFTIDYKNKKIYLETAAGMTARRKSGKARIPLQLEDSREKSLDIFGYFTLGGKLHLQLLLDSGAGKDVFRFHSRYMAALAIDTRDTINIVRKGHRSEIDTSFISYTYTTKVARLSARNAPSVSVDNFRATFVDGLIYDGIVCINWLGDQLTFDLAKKELIVN